MALYLTGNTSNITIDSTSGITFPNATLQASAGVILQVVQNTTTSAISTTSTSFVTTGFSVSITPKFTTSKVLVFVNGGGGFASTSGTSLWATIYRNSTNLGDSTYGLERIYAGSSNVLGPHSMCILDSPATTSSTSYTCYYRSSGATVDFSSTDRGFVTITAMEVA
jgi:hypothetical protein